MFKIQQLNNKISSVEKYFTIIDGDIFIDYICFNVENERSFCLTLDSSGENIIFISTKEMNDSIKELQSNI